MFSSKTVNDLTETIIHSHRQLIHVQRFTSVQLVNGKKIIVNKIQFLILNL